MSRKRTQRPHVARRAVWPRRLALLLFAFGLMMFGGWSLATKVSRAAGSPVEDSWRETPALNMVYYWQLYERRDGKYAEDWPENKLLAVDTFLFGYRQALLDMDITAHIANNHADRVWVELNNSSTNYPDQLAAKKIYDYPPHLNAHLPWRNPNWSGDTNAHFYTSDTGQISSVKYAYHIGNCPSSGPTLPAPGVWIPKVDGACAVVYEEGFTPAGEIQLRLGPGAPIYLLRNKGVSDLDVVRDGQVLYNIKILFYDASLARLLMQITDYRQNRVTFEEILADRDTGQISSHTRQQVEMQPLATPPYLFVAARSSQRVKLAWADIANQESSFEIERSTGGEGGPYSLLVNTSANAQYWVDSSAQPQTTYCYRVRAVSGSGASAYSHLGCATTPADLAHALDLGSSSYITFGDPLELKLTQFTLEGWIKREGAGLTTSTGSGGFTGIPLITKGASEADGSNVDMNYFLGIHGTQNTLCADFEEGPGGTGALGRNYSVCGATPLQNDTWYHVAATYDGAWRLYLNGALEATRVVNQPVRADSIQHAALGSSIRSNGGSSGRFDGVIDEVRIWNYARSQPEILATRDLALPSVQPGLVARWSLNEGTRSNINPSAYTNVEGRILGASFSWTPGGAPLGQAANQPPGAPQLIAPASGAGGVSTAPTLQATATDPNGDPLTLSFYGRPHATGGGVPFTLVVIPDTQYYTLSDSAMTPFFAQTQWIVNQRSTLGIVFATHVGDLTENGSVHAEWQRASAAMAVLDNNGLPNGVVPGNHDQDTVNQDTSDFLTYDQYFPPSRYEPFPWYGSYLGDPGDGINDFGVNRLNKDSYQLFSAGGMDFLIIHLELDPPQYAIDWANAVLARYPNHRAVVVTHAFIDTTATRRTTPYIRRTIGKSAEYVWQNVIFPNCNVFLVLNGHYPGEANRTDANRCGAPVHQVLQDYQSRPNGGDGWLRYFIFEPAEDQIEAYTYSPTRNRFETDANSRFTLSYEMETAGPFQLIGSVSTPSGGTGQLQWTGLAPNTTYEWYVSASDGQQTTGSAVWGFTTGDNNNQAPVANNDSYSIGEDQPLVVAAPGVLGNDSDADGHALSAELVGAPAHGTLTLNRDGSFSYTPAANYHGSDAFTYRAGDGQATSAVATVGLTVNPVNDAPVAVNDLATVPQDTAAAIPVLGNDSDVDGDALTLIAVSTPAHGTAVANADGTVTYTPAPGYSGGDSFTYTAGDGQGGSATATVIVTVTAPPSSVIFADGFECDRSAWSGVVNSKVMEFNATAAYNSPCGMKLNITSTSPAYLIDQSPAGETSYQARFAFHPNGLSMAEGDEYPIFRAYRPDAVAHMTVDVRYDGSRIQVRAGLANDLRRWAFTPWVTLTDQWHLLDVSWRSAAGPGSNDGGLAFSVDGVQVAAGDTVDNDEQRLEWVQMGAVRSIEPTTLGSTFFDDFFSSRDGAETVGGMMEDAPAGLSEEEYDDEEDPSQQPSEDPDPDDDPAQPPAAGHTLYLPNVQQ